MGQTSIALLITLLAGVSAVLGAFAVYLRQTNTDKIITASLGFATGLMVTVSTAELLPHSHEVLEGLMPEKMAVLVSVGILLLGFLCGAGIDRLIPHHHCGHDHHSHQEEHCGSASLYRIGIASLLGLALHNIPEGAALYLTSRDDAALGISMAVAIAMHSIPEGISIAMPIYVSTKSRSKAFFYTLLAGLAMPLGGLIACVAFGPFLSDMLFGMVYRCV